jgi:hypothetical protein
LFLNGYLGFSGVFSLDNASKIAPFVGSFVGVFFTLASSLLVLENLRITTTNNNLNQLLTQKNQFETVFFGLLTQQRQIRESIQSTVALDGVNEIETKGSNFFDDLATLLAKEFSSKEQNEGELIKLYNHWFTIYNSDLGHYFRHLYHIVKFVDLNPFFIQTSGNTIFLSGYDYVKILRAQLSNSELIMLSLNGMTEQGFNFHPLIEKYKLLKNINLEEKLPTEYHSRVPNAELIKNKYQHLKDR